MKQASGPAKMVWALPHDVVRQPGETVYVGGAVDVELVLVEREEVVVAARHFTAYPEAFAFVLHVWLSEPDSDVFTIRETLQHDSRRRRRGRHNLYVTVEMPNGTLITGFYDGKPADEPGLELYNDSGGPEHHEVEIVACVAAPQSGAIRIVFNWEARGIVDARASIDASLLTQAAHDARPLFAVADRP